MEAMTQAALIRDEEVKVGGKDQGGAGTLSGVAGIYTKLRILRLSLAYKEQEEALTLGSAAGGGD